MCRLTRTIVMVAILVYRNHPREVLLASETSRRSYWTEILSCPGCILATFYHGYYGNHQDSMSNADLIVFFKTSSFAACIVISFSHHSLFVFAGLFYEPRISQPVGSYSSFFHMMMIIEAPSVVCIIIFVRLSTFHLNSLVETVN